MLGEEPDGKIGGRGVGWPVVRKRDSSCITDQEVVKMIQSVGVVRK